jgi:serine/threonine protein kinase
MMVLLLKDFFILTATCAIVEHHPDEQHWGCSGRPGGVDANHPVVDRVILLGDARRHPSVFSSTGGAMAWGIDCLTGAKEVDARSDLFSFGCVLYEMLTGKRAFEGSSPASVIAAILEREPAPVEVARPIDRVVRRSLAKDPDQRFQTARDLKARFHGCWSNLLQ